MFFIKDIKGSGNCLEKILIIETNQSQSPDNYLYSEYLFEET